MLQGWAIVALLLFPLPFAAGAALAPADPFAAARWTPYPSPAAFVRDAEAAFGMSDPTHGPASGVNAAAIDLASGAWEAGGVIENPGPEPTLLVAVDDPDHLLLRMRLGDSPLQPGSGGALYKAYHWDFLLDADGDGMSEFVVDVFGGDRAATAGSPRYKDGSVALFNNHACEDVPTGDALVDNSVERAPIVWSAPANAKTNPNTRVDAAGAQAWLSVAVPWSALAYRAGQCAGAPALQPGEAFGLFASTSASNTNPLQKDWMASVVLAPALTLEKTVDATEARPGSLLRYAILVRNDGSGAARDVLVRDPLPAHTDLVSADAGGALDPATGEVVWAIGTLQPGASVTLHLEVRVLDDLPVSVETLTNVAFAGDAASNAVSLPVLRAALPTLAVAASPAAAGPGDALALLVDVANLGDAAATEAFLIVRLAGPAALGAHEGCEAIAPDTLRCALGDLAAGEHRAFSIPALVHPTLAAGAYEVLATARLEHAGGAVDAGPAIVDVLAGAQLVVEATATPPQLGAGETSRFDLAYTNLGNGTAVDARLAWISPPGVVIVGISPGGVLGDDGVVRWSLGDVLAGGAGSRWVDVALAPNAPAGETAVQGEAVLDASNAPVASAPAELVLIVLPDLLVQALATPAVVGPGDEVQLRIEYANDGDADAHDVVLLLALDGPATLTGPSEWSLGTLLVGQGGVVETTARADEALPVGTHTLAFSPRLTASDASGARGASALVTVLSGVELVLQAEASPAAARPGDLVTWTLTWTNRGNGTTSEGLLVDRPWPGVEVASISEGGMLDANGFLQWTVSPLGPGESGSAPWTGRLPSIMPAGSTLVANDASLRLGDVPEARSTAATLVTAAPNLILSIEADREATGPGGVVQYTIRFANDGDAHADVATVELRLAGPATAREATWSVGPVLVGEPGRIVAWADVHTDLLHGDHVATAQASIATPGVAPTLAGPEDVLVVARGLLTLDAQVAPSAARPGDVARWTLTYGNAGNATLPAVLLEDRAPPAFVHVTPEDGGSLDGDRIVWNVGSLAPGALGRATFAATVPKPMPAGRTLHADDARIDAGDAGSATARATLAVDAAPALEVVKRVDRASAVAGDHLTYSLEVRNVGDAHATGVLLSDRIPDLVTFVSATGNGGYQEASRTIQWVVGPLAVGEVATVGFVARLAPILPETETPVVNVGLATSAEGVEATSPPVTTLARGVAAIALEKLADVARAEEGTRITYTITVTSVGSADAREVLLVDALPQGHAFVSVQPAAATWDGTAARLLIPLLPVGASETLRIVARVQGVLVPRLETCNVVVGTGANVLLATAKACVDLTCSLPDPVLPRASALAAPVGSVPRSSASAERLEPGRLDRHTRGETFENPNVKLQVSNATASAEVAPHRSHARSTLDLGRVDLLGGRIKADAILTRAEVTVDNVTGTSSSDGTRFVNLTIDGVPYDNVAPNTIVSLGTGGYVALREVDLRSTGPTHGPDGIPARTATLRVTMLRIHPLADGPTVGTPLGSVATRTNSVSIGVTEAHATFGVEPDCARSGRQPRVLAEATDVRGASLVAAHHARVAGAAGGEIAHGVAARTNDATMDLQSLMTRAAANVTDKSGDAQAEVHLGRVVLLGGLVTADGLYARISTTLGGPAVVEEVRWVNLTVAGERIEQDVAPNTRLVAGTDVVVLNERVHERSGAFRLTLIRVGGGEQPAAVVGELRVGAVRQ